MRSWCFSDPLEPLPYYTSDSVDFVLTGKTYEQLKRQALLKENAEAAIRISSYFSRYEHDSVEGTKWLMLAQSLGSTNATYNLSQIDEAIRIEAKKRYDQAVSDPAKW